MFRFLIGGFPCYHDNQHRRTDVTKAYLMSNLSVRETSLWKLAGILLSTWSEEDDGD